MGFICTLSFEVYHSPKKSKLQRLAAMNQADSNLISSTVKVFTINHAAIALHAPISFCYSANYIIIYYNYPYTSLSRFFRYSLVNNMLVGLGT
jgi:hypothetical protein